MTKMQRGLTVQWCQQGHYAFCVRCQWRSAFTKYANAVVFASTPGIHRCPRATL